MTSAEAVATTAPQLVAIADMLRDDRYQARSKLDPGTVARYAGAVKSGQRLPAVTLFRIAGTLVLASGFHRVAAHVMAGMKDAEAVILEGTARDALAFAATTNLTNALPLKGAEVRRAFRMYIASRGHYHAGNRLKSYREIVADLRGVKSRGTIHTWMKKDYPRIARQMAHEEGPKGLGGVREVTAGDTLHTVAAEGIQRARTAARGVACPHDRGLLIADALEFLEELKAGGKWTADARQADF